MVELEDALVSLDGNGDDTSIDGGLKLRDAVSWDLRPALDVDDSLGLFGRVASASLTMSGGVWVVGLEGLGVGLQEVEGFVLPSTTATVASFVARDNFLLGEAQKSTSGSEVSELSDGGGTESPA